MASSRQDTFDPDKTTEAVQSFFALEGRMLTPKQIAQKLGRPSPMQHPDLGPLLNFRGSLGTVWVSPRYHVVYYSGEAMPAGNKKPISATEGYDMANRFAERHVADFTQRNYEAEPPEADADSVTQCWTEHPGSGTETSIFPNWVEIVVDLTQGRVKRFSASDLHLVRTTPPGIDRKQAEARIKAGFEKAAIEDIELMEQPLWDGDPKVITVWSASVLTLGPEGPMTVRVTINADTGEVVPE